MGKHSERQDKEWGKFEEEVLKELRQARERGLLTGSLDEIEEIVDEMGKGMQVKLLGAIAEQREGEGTERCGECGEKMQRRGKSTRQVKTSQGEVSFKRERWVCPKCGTSLFPPG